MELYYRRMANLQMVIHISLMQSAFQVHKGIRFVKPQETRHHELR